MPTLSCLFYLLLVGMSYLLRVSHRGWFGLYLLLAVVTVPLLLLLLSLPAALSMKLELRAPSFASKNSDGEFELSFSSRSLLPVGRIKVWVRAENRFTREYAPSKPVYYGLCTGVQTLPIPTESCGQLLVSVTRWECRDLLGLIAIRKRCPAPVTCTVLPRSGAPDRPVDFDEALKSLAHLKPKYGGGFSEEHDLRDYRPGDMGNSIHWKLSSKTDRLIVREALEQENREIFLVLSGLGDDDRGLEVLYWLSRELINRELPHILAVNDLYPVGNEEECLAAFAGLLAVPFGWPCAFDAARARCIFRISGGEVTTR